MSGEWPTSARKFAMISQNDSPGNDERRWELRRRMQKRPIKTYFFLLSQCWALFVTSSLIASGTDTQPVLDPPLPHVSQNLPSTWFSLVLRTLKKCAVGKTSAKPINIFCTSLSKKKKVFLLLEFASLKGMQIIVRHFSYHQAIQRLFAWVA